MTLPESGLFGAPGLIARTVSAAIRRRIRRHVVNGVVDHQELRRRFGQPRWLRRLLGRRSRVTRVEAPIRGEWVEPRSGPTPRRVVLYLHGGGYIFCSSQTHRPITSALSRYAGARVFAPDYRLAPEHPFPAALDDALATVRWLYAQGVRPGQLTIAGDSAGGGLTLATLVALRDAGDPLPAGGVLFSAWTDLAATGASITENDGRCAMFHADNMIPSGNLYRGAEPATHPLVSPLYSGLHGLPPLLVQYSRSELLRDDSTRVVAKARAAGVTVVDQAWPDLPHVWHLFAEFMPEARFALRQAARFIAHLTPDGGGGGVYSPHEATHLRAPDGAQPAGPAPGTGGAGGARGDTRGG